MNACVVEYGLKVNEKKSYVVCINGPMGMVKYVTEQSGIKYVIGMEGWKTMIVSKLMYGCGARGMVPR